MASVDSFSFVRDGRIHFYCPLCHNHQTTNVIERVQWKHHAQLALFTVVFTILAWPIFETKGIFFYLIFWAGFEFIHRLKKRHSLVCNTCGFDPFLYKQDVKKAREAVRKFWEEKIEKENAFQGVKLKNYSSKAKELDADNAAPNLLSGLDKKPSTGIQAKAP